MTPRAPPRTRLPKEETRKYSCYHTSSETQRRERKGGAEEERERERER